MEVDGEEYFYLHVIPFQDLDFHFFLFQPKKEAFELVEALGKDTIELVRALAWQMRIVAVISLIIVLIILHFFSKRLTKPIVEISVAAQKVAEGQYEEAELPEPKESESNDEVQQLYISFAKMIRGLIEKEKVRGVLDKVVSSEIADEILKGDIHLGGEERMVTVLFADIRGFTPLSENMPPADVISILNECMTRISKVINAHGGVIDKFVGDEVMALFGVPIEQPGAAVEAVKCATEIIIELEKWNLEREAQGKEKILMGVGVHKGEMIAGNMGSENRLNYTVIGANVNLAFRLCAVAKPMEVLISESVLNDESVKQIVDVQREESFQLKGFTGEIKAFGVRIKK